MILNNPYIFFQQLYLKARFMKEIIDQLRKIIWEVNTMLAMSNT